MIASIYDGPPYFSKGTEADPCWRRPIRITRRYLDAETKGAFDAFVDGEPSRFRVTSATRRYAVVEVVNEKLVHAFYLLDLHAGDARELWTSPTAEYRVASTWPATIRARDGRTGYLTLPPGRADRFRWF